MPRPLALAIALALAIGASASSALAQQDDARARFAAAQTTFDEGKYEDALAAFTALVAETKSPNAQLYVARSLHKLGRLPAAYDAMQATVRDATERAAAEPKYAATRDAAASELAVLAVKVGHIVVALADAPEGASVSLDGAPLAAERLGSPVTVDPGSHVVELVVAGAAPVRRSIQVAGGETKTIALAAGAPAVAPTAAPSRPPDAEPGGGGGGVRIAGIVMGGAGVAALGVGLVTGLMASSEFSSLEEECGGARCTDPGAADTIDGGKTLETIANVGFIGGAVLVVAAVPMIVLGGPDDAPATALTFGPASATLRGRF